jgi:hypothetical protein
MKTFPNYQVLRTIWHRAPKETRKQSWDRLPHSGTNLARARTSRDFINIYNTTDDVLAFRYFMQRAHGWQSVLNCILNDHGKENRY